MLQNYDAAQIANIENIGEAVHVKRMADAASVFYKAQDAWAEAQKAQEYRLRAIRSAGTILLPPAQGGQAERSAGGRGNVSSGLTSLLEDAGISRETGNAWQKVARVPADKFEAYFIEAEYWMDDFSVAGLLRFSGDWYGKSNIKEWESPQWLFDLLDKEFDIAIDVCANEHNAKCPMYFFLPDLDGHKQDWGTSTCWMNPPYGSEIKRWMQKARESAEGGATVICLVPARPDTEWWWDNCIGGEIRFIRGRLTFEGASSGAPFPSAVIVMSPDATPGKVVWWDVRP